MEEAYRIRERILDEHPLGVAQDQLACCAFAVIGEQDGRLVVAEVLDEELAVGTF
jgi:hypothetical protein